MVATLSLLNSLDSASFRGIPFLIPGEVSTTGGRKKVVHEFLNSDRRVVNDQGRFENVFTVPGIIVSDEGRQTYFDRKNALINALQKKDAGILSHPLFGKIQVVPDKYTISESFGELGLATFNMKFYQADSEITPALDEFTAFNVMNRSDQVVEFIGQEIVDKFSVSLSFPFNFSSATNKLESIVSEIDEVTTTFRRQLSEIDSFAKTLNDFRNSIRTLVNLPSELSASLSNLLDSAIALAATPEDAFLTLEKLFPFGLSDPLIQETTAERIEDLLNRTLLNQFIQVGSLSRAYEQVVSIDFFTIREIDEYALKLNRQYDIIYPSLTNVDLARSISLLRSTANEFLDQQRLNVKQIVAFETGPTTVQALTYSLYGNLENSEKIAALNSIKDVDFISGELEIFR